MSQPEFMWECACGHIEYALKSPKKCIKCGKQGEFMQANSEEINLPVFTDNFVDEILGDEE